jgi:predicted nucleic acid-binding protein
MKLIITDTKLRIEANNQGIEVHGTIWVIERLVENDMINKAMGIQLLESLKQVNSSLPLDEIDKLIKNFKK